MGADARKMADGSTAWVKDGILGLSVEKDGVKIELDADLMLDLMADTLRSGLIEELEQMDTAGVFKFFGLNRPL